MSVSQSANKREKLSYLDVDGKGGQNMLQWKPRREDGSISRWNSGLFSSKPFLSCYNTRKVTPTSKALTLRFASAAIKGSPCFAKVIPSFLSYAKCRQGQTLMRLPTERAVPKAVLSSSRAVFLAGRDERDQSLASSVQPDRY
jgi:hypothetical protein